MTPDDPTLPAQLGQTKTRVNASGLLLRPWSCRLLLRCFFVCFHLRLGRLRVELAHTLAACNMGTLFGRPDDVVETTSEGDRGRKAETRALNEAIANAGKEHGPEFGGHWLTHGVYGRVRVRMDHRRGALYSVVMVCLTAVTAELEAMCRLPYVAETLTHLHGQSHGDMSPTELANMLLTRYDSNDSGALNAKQVQAMRTELSKFGTSPFYVFVETGVAYPGATVKGVVVMHLDKPLAASRCVSCRCVARGALFRSLETALSAFSSCSFGTACCSLTPCVGLLLCSVHVRLSADLQVHFDVAETAQIVLSEAGDTCVAI